MPPFCKGMWASQEPVCMWHAGEITTALIGHSSGLAWWPPPACGVVGQCAVVLRK